MTMASCARGDLLLALGAGDIGERLDAPLQEIAGWL
jgi:hypothetical protein